MSKLLVLGACFYPYMFSRAAPWPLITIRAPELMDYDAQLKELQDTTTTASLNYEIWWIFRGSETRPKYVDVMNHYRLYFHAAIGAHFVAMLVALYRLYETRPDTHNIPK